MVNVSELYSIALHEYTTTLPFSCWAFGLFPIFHCCKEFYSESSCMCLFIDVYQQFSSAWGIAGFGDLYLVAQLVKNPPVMRETWVRSLGWEDPLEKKKATYSSILAWRIPWSVHGIPKSWTRLSDFHFHFQASRSNFWCAGRTRDRGTS